MSTPVLIHFDGAVEPINPGGHLGYAWVAFDEAGREVAHESKAELPFPTNTNNQAEYKALIAALEWCAANGHRGVVIRGDSQLVIYQMIGTYRVNSPTIRVLHAEAQRLAREVGARFEWVRREQNAVADVYSKAAFPMGVTIRSR